MPVTFKKILIADERYESAGFIDVMNRGVLDIVSGAFWYEGPHFKRRHKIGDIRAEGEYFDDFSTIPLDVNGDGFTDFVTGGWWGDTVRWRENPGKLDEPWPEHVIANCGNVETTRGWDVDGDGQIEIVPNTPGRELAVYKLKTDDSGKGAGEFAKHVIRSEPQGHGLGCGDITGNGRKDFLLSGGWLEAPAKPFEEPWLWHDDLRIMGSASVPILVADVNRDGLNDIIVGGGHEYGLDWYEQRIEDGLRTWIKHRVDPWNSQYHDMKWIDIDGDGECELVTGKRYRAHCGHDPGAEDPVGIYYFKWTGETLAKQVIDYGPPRQATGLGIHFDTADLTGNGLPDILAPGKDGLYLFLNEGA